MSKYKAALQEIRDTLYGQNIELTNWHLNGTTEPFDNFAENNGWFDDLDSQDEQLTLRDEFAMGAMSAVLSAITVADGIDRYDQCASNEQLSKHAYQIADAMLKERSK